MAFYGITTTQNGTSKVIKDFTSTDRLGVENEAKAYCKKNSLTFQYVLPTKTLEKKGATLTKNKRERDRVANKR